MYVSGPTKRIRPKFTEIVKVPPELRRWAWDAVNGRIMLEILVHRIMCNSSSYEAVKLAYKLWPEACIYVVKTYNDVFRGCRAAVREWSNPWNWQKDF